MEMRTLWKVLLSRLDDESLAGEEWDNQMDAIAEACPDLMDSGSGYGFGRRFLDYTFTGRASAQQVVDAAEASTGISGIDIQLAEVEPDLDG